MRLRKVLQRRAVNMAKKKPQKTVETIIHDEASRKNIPTAEYQSIMVKEDQESVRVAYERRNRDLDPQLVWRGKDEQDWSDLIVQAQPLFIQEKVHPKVLIDDLIQRTQSQKKETEEQLNLFDDFNGIEDENAKTEFYQHDANWTNRMILGDSLQVMASLAEREGLRGKVQCIYIDPPYGIKFNSNFQWSTTSRDVKDGKVDHITREPEQVKAYRDTWRDGIHSYLTYLRDRLTVARDLLKPSGSIFVQISNENVHRIRLILDEIFGIENSIATIAFKKASPDTKTIKNSFNYILWYAKDIENLKSFKLFRQRVIADGTTEDPKKLALWLLNSDGVERPLTTDEKRSETLLPRGSYVFRADKVRDFGKIDGKNFKLNFKGEQLDPGPKHSWRGYQDEMIRLYRANRLLRTKETLAYKYFLSDNLGVEISNYWGDTAGKITDMRFVVETNEKVIARCLLIASAPGDLVVDPTCGSGTTAYVAEKWGRRWITIDTSRVALALARSRIMGARYPYYLLADSKDGQQKEAELSQTEPSFAPTYGDIRQGFVYERVPHITLKSIANNTEIDVIWEKHHKTLEPLREKLNRTLNKQWEEWEIPREADEKWPAEAKDVHGKWWEQRIARQKEIDASIVAKADYEYLYDKPYEDKKKVRVAGPFTVESLSPHRVLSVNEDDELIDSVSDTNTDYDDGQGFVNMVLENLRISGVQQAHKEDKITFTSITPWPGHFISAEGRFVEGNESSSEKRAAIFIGPEFGTVSRLDLVEAAREAGDGGFDVLITCAFSYDAHSSELNKLGRIPILKARMNADLHMADDLKNTGKGNLFVIFGEPDIDITEVDKDKIQVKINGVDVFHPNTGEIRSDGPEGIACWFIDTDYNEESFFVRHAYFLGASDPYKALKNTLKSEINEEAWASLNSDTSRPFERPSSGRIAVKVINHLGDEVMKIFRV